MMTTSSDAPTQEWVAEFCRISQPTVSGIMSGSKPPGAMVRLSIERATGWDIDDQVRELEAGTWVSTFHGLMIQVWRSRP